jgi:ATP-binding protein involved in chromosome partitioning
MPEAAATAAGARERGQARQARLEGIRRVIAVSSCKGGVGKSTVAVNLALAMAARGRRVGLADVDIYGPSAPMMLGITGQPKPGPDNLIPPLEAHGIEVMSMGFFLDDAAPVIWRGPMAMSATRQFVRGAAWSELDCLVVDLPPGTGDIVLTLCQEVPLDGAVIVTTPQDVALADVKRGVSMFHKVNTPVLGVVQNMSTYVCPKCGTRDDLFGARTGEQLAAELGLPLLADIPIDEIVCESGDAGTPVVVSRPDHPVARAFTELAARVEAAADAAAASKAVPEPIEIEDDKRAGVIRIRWSDDVVTEYDPSGLRGWCPCAQCQGHSGERKFVPAAGAELTSFEVVGRYAVCFTWADGHSTGIYSYPYLREIADRPECRPA